MCIGVMRGEERQCVVREEEKRRDERRGYDVLCVIVRRGATVCVCFLYDGIPCHCVLCVEHLCCRLR